MATQIPEGLRRLTACDLFDLSISHPMVRDLDKRVQGIAEKGIQRFTRDVLEEQACVRTLRSFVPLSRDNQLTPISMEIAVRTALDRITTEPQVKRGRYGGIECGNMKVRRSQRLQVSRLFERACDEGQKYLAVVIANEADIENTVILRQINICKMKNMDDTAAELAYLVIHRINDGDRHHPYSIDDLHFLIDFCESRKLTRTAKFLKGKLAEKTAL